MWHWRQQRRFNPIGGHGVIPEQRLNFALAPRKPPPHSALDSIAGCVGCFAAIAKG